MSKVEHVEAVSILDFDERSEHDQGVEIELKKANGKPTGIFVTVVGEHSSQVTAFMTRSINARRRQDAVNARKGKLGEVRSFEDDIETTVERAAASVTGWRGPKEPFAEPALRSLLSRNPSFVSQILDASSESSAFIKG